MSEKVSFKKLIRAAIAEHKNKAHGAVVAGEYYDMALAKIMERDPKRFREWLVELASTNKNGLREVVSASDSQGWTVFHVSCNSGRLEEAFALLEAGSDVHAPTAIDSTTSLCYLAKLTAQERQPISVYNQLLHVLAAHGANLNHQKTNGETALHVACSRGNEIAAAFLINAGADVSRTTKEGFAPIHYAVLGNHAEIVKMLCEHNCDIKTSCKQGDPIGMARSRNFVDVLKILEEAIQAVPAKQRMSVIEEVTFVDRTTPSVQGSYVAIEGCWDEYRDKIYSKTHFVFYLDTLFYLCIMPNRPSTVTRCFEGLVIDNMGFRKFSVQADQLLLYKELSVGEQLRQFLNSRGDLSNRRNASTHLAALNSTGRTDLEWKISRLPDISMRLLELESKLCPRKRICVGVVLGRNGQEHEEEMFLNYSSTKFERFLSILGEKCTVDPSFPGFLGSLDSCDDAGQACVYASWMGFEIVFFAAPLLDPVRQRQHLGNCNVLIYFGASAPLRRFRGQVNSVAFCISPVPTVAATAKSPRARKSLVERKQSISESTLSVPSSAESSPRHARMVKIKRKLVVRMSCFFRSKLQNFSPVLPEGEVDLVKEKFAFRNILLGNVVNAHWASLRQGAYALNTAKLFVASVSKIIEEDKSCK